MQSSSNEAGHDARDERSSSDLPALLFIVAVGLGGLGGMLGSIVGNAGGRPWLYVGGVVGGVAGAVAAGVIAAGRGWIPARARTGASAGGAIGFLAAAAIATQTLGSPIGPVLSTLLIGAGAVAGYRLSR